MKTTYITLFAIITLITACSSNKYIDDEVTMCQTDYIYYNQCSTTVTLCTYMHQGYQTEEIVRVIAPKAYIVPILNYMPSSYAGEPWEYNATSKYDSLTVSNGSSMIVYRSKNNDPIFNRDNYEKIDQQGKYYYAFGWTFTDADFEDRARAEK